MVLSLRYRACRDSLSIRHPPPLPFLPCMNDYFGMNWETMSQRSNISKPKQ